LVVALQARAERDEAAVAVDVADAVEIGIDTSTAIVGLRCDRDGMRLI
jgi:hypothetical protein